MASLPSHPHQDYWISTLPELPEVETVVRTLSPHVLHGRILSMRLLRQSSLHPLSLPPESLANLEISGLWRRGKLVVFDLKDHAQGEAAPTTMVIHLRMTGALLPYPKNSAPAKHTRCIFDLLNANGNPLHLFFDDIRTFGKILIANSLILEKWPFWQNLGPEPLEIGHSAFRKRLAGNKILKSALLDQTVVAGIGNIYADEALFQAGLNPMRKSNSLNDRECQNLLAALKDVLTRSIEQCGSSIRDYKDANGKAGAFQNSFQVYGKGGEKCPRCRGMLQKTRVGGRGTVFCPHCQQ